MIEIYGEDISRLSDSDLRSLIGLLCEADLRSLNLPTAGVTWGGHQNAKDGGIDVRVDLSTALQNDGYVPRSKTGFQVKKPDMNRAAIISEMKPSGKLRQVIQDLADAKGAYIIVSSQGSTADSALKDRKKAMQEALEDYPNATNIKLDFYDRERIAGWVRSHPPLVLWVRDKIGQPIQGWRPYGNWAASPNGVEEEYMLDKHIRLYNNPQSKSNGLSALDGINEVRSMLHKPKSSIRLVGLSGVGKTRFLQALFDERIGEKPLNKSQVFYTDINDSPNPHPTNIAERIVSLKKPAILAIDNCPPSLHRRLTSICAANGSQVRLITIEYDVREDQPEETEVIRLEPASTELIEKVISARFPYINEIGARSIADFSGGNARIAIALSSRVKRGENLAELKDSELFNRLFQQRNDYDKSLIRAAEACSLVYSFNNQMAEDTDIELRLLGSLVGMEAREVYENVSELMRRDLVQKRSLWRAVLPHAIANKLAKRALENIPVERICYVFEKGGSERLLKSFSRRLSYLHESEVAVGISRKWLEEDGLLGDVSNLNELGINLLKNVAPLNPDLTLASIERVTKRENTNIFFSRNNINYNFFTRILRSLAYDENLFVRSAELLCRFALSEKNNENHNPIRRLVKSLFYLYLSGTHASAEQRLSIIKNLTESNSEKENELGLFLLDAALESWHFSSFESFEFGAHSRDYGFVPKDKREETDWYQLFIEYTVNLSTSQYKVAPKAKNLLAKKFRGLWTKASMYDQLETASKIISTKNSWGEGWIAIQETKRFDSKRMDEITLSRLNDLSRALKPDSLVEKVRVYVLLNSNVLNLIETLNIEGESKYFQLEERVRSLGKEVGLKEDIFKETLVELVSNDNQKLFAFGQGLAEGCENPEKMWSDLCDQLVSVEQSKRKYQVFRGFLNGLFNINESLVEKILDEAVENDLLSAEFPFLQTGVRIDIQAIERLKRSLQYGAAPVWQYNYLNYGRIHEAISDAELSELINTIASYPDGIEVAVDILSTRLSFYSEKGKISDILKIVGQEIILKCQLTREINKGGRISYELTDITDKCFMGESAKVNAQVLYKKLFKSIESNSVNVMDWEGVLNALARNQPIMFLNELLEQNSINQRTKRLFLKNINPFLQIDNDLIINWCKTDPTNRYPFLASAIIPFRKRNEEDALEWTPLAKRILENVDEPTLILDIFKSSFWPRSWSGSLAEKLQRRLGLISILKKCENLSIADWAEKEEIEFKEIIRLERNNELKRERERNERFE
ncbi:hypothetical protein [Domibacillus tundrae]|uniref:hypothetical protein n=1 Tax=Domibacillus tundrae TaxID=1587527 RepID=UPI0006182112|nr:hypothetical protein [Domibacillus tundrae]